MEEGRTRYPLSCRRKVVIYVMLNAIGSRRIGHGVQERTNRITRLEDRAQIRRRARTVSKIIKVQTKQWRQYGSVIAKAA